MDTEEIRKIMLKNETTLGKYASRDKDAIRFEPMDKDIRTNYFRDIDRIIHTSAYTRYIDKTQVFTHWGNDNVSRRSVHVQLVAKIGRTIGRALSLNEDLIEAIALGHDIGHVPFGHLGEALLNEITEKNLGEIFAHNVESVRELMVLERNGEGINATVQVLDGILCHNGEIISNKYEPQEKSMEEFLNIYEKCYKDKTTLEKLTPMTLEGCVVRISDLIAYLGRDVEDAIKLGVLKENPLPSSITEVLGTTNGEIVNTIIMDIITNSMGKPYLKISDDVFNAMMELKKFNYENIYSVASPKRKKDKCRTIFNELFTYYLENINNKECSINRIYLSSMNEEYLKNTSNKRKVVDYIAGMTDSFILREYKEYKNDAKNKRI